MFFFLVRVVSVSVFSRERAFTPQNSRELLETWAIMRAGLRSLDPYRNAKSESTGLNKSDTKSRKHGYRKGLETLVVHAVNDASYFR